MSKLYWVDRTWGGFGSLPVTGNTPEEALSKAKIARNQDLNAMQHWINQARNAPLSVESDDA